MVRRTIDRQQRRVNSWWKFLLAKMDAALVVPPEGKNRRKAVAVLLQMRLAVASRNPARILELAPDYLRLTRTLPPCVYAFAPPPWKNVYLDGEALEKGLRIAKLSLGIVHPQIYR